MKGLTIFVLTIIFITTLSSCGIKNIKHRSAENPISGAGSNNVATFTCDDLKAINKILFITFAYDQKYDLDGDNTVTVQDKLIIEENLLQNSASCVSSLRTCDDLQAVEDEITSWPASSDMQMALIRMKQALAYSIIFNESGEKCHDDFSTGSFIGDVNKNGYLECNDPVAIKAYVANPTKVNGIFEPALADVNASNTITGLDALYEQMVLSHLFINYMDNLGDCLPAQ